jgi:protoporphyrinogen oxidase
VKKILTSNGKVTGIQTEGMNIPCDAVISTIPYPGLADLLDSPDLAHLPLSLSSIKYIGVQCMLLRLDRSFSRYFWLNVNDNRIAFNGVIEFSNLNMHYHGQGLHLLYIPFYLPADSARYAYSDDRIFDEYMEALKLIRSDFDRRWVKDFRVSRYPYAQAICTTGFSSQVPENRSPLSGLYITDSVQFYPEDRTLSAAIRLGKQAAVLLSEDFHL